MEYDKGHPIIFQDGQWVYEDTHEPIKAAPRRCRRCGRGPTDTGHDRCLGELPGVKYACCGHGVSVQAYVWFTNGKYLRGFNVTKDLSEVSSQARHS